MTQDQFKAALEDAHSLLTVLAQILPDQVSDDLLSHLKHSVENPCSLTLLYTSVQAASVANQKQGKGLPRVAGGPFQ